MVPAYDVVIVGDDAAFQFAMTYRDELFAQTPVVFEGVNDGELAKKAAADPLVTGVVETLSYENTITLAKKLYPDARQVVGILDDTVTGEGERKEFQYYDTVFPICSCETISPPKNPFPIPCETIENIGICATSPSIWIASAAAYTFPSPSLLHII